MIDTYNKYLCALGVLCLAAVIVAAAFLPGARLGFLLPAYVVGGAAMLFIYSRCAFRVSAGSAVLMAAYTLVVCGIIWNIHFFTVESGGTYSHPVLVNTDSRTDWSRAVNRLYGDPQPDFPGLMGVRYYGYVIQGLMFVFGRDIGVPLMFNAFCYAMTVILVGAVTWRLASNRTTSLLSMVITCLMCYLMVQSTVLLKDVPLAMCVAAMCLVMARWRMGKGVAIDDVLILIPALVGLAFFRANFLLMLVLGLVIFGVGKRSFDLRFAVLIAVVLALFFAMHTFFHFPTVKENVDVAYGTGVFVHNDNVRAWDNMLVDDYEAMPIWRRLLWLPASVVVQYLIPFPWNFQRDMVYGPTECVAHFGYFWYYAGAVLLFWIFVCSRKSPVAMRLFVLWGVLLTIATAYMTSGRVSRYCLIYLPMLLPAVAFTLVQAKHSVKLRSKLGVWLGIFTLLLIPVLLICYNLQMSGR